MRALHWPTSEFDAWPKRRASDDQKYFANWQRSPSALPNFRLYSSRRPLREGASSAPFSFQSRKFSNDPPSQLTDSRRLARTHFRTKDKTIIISNFQTL